MFKITQPTNNENLFVYTIKKNNDDDDLSPIRDNEIEETKNMLKNLLPENNQQLAENILERVERDKQEKLKQLEDEKFNDFEIIIFDKKQKKYRSVPKSEAWRLIPANERMTNNNNKSSRN